MQLYYNILSPYAQKAVLAFYEKGLEFTPHVVQFDPESKAAYRKIYPLGKIPLLVGEGVFIPESSIIVEYLENEFASSGTSLIPADKTAARRVRFMDRMADNYVNNQVNIVFFDGMKPAELRNPHAVAGAHEVLTTTLAYLDSQLADKPFICGESISMADLALFGPLLYAQRMHPYAGHKNVSAYFERLMQRPSIQRMMQELGPALAKMAP